jgi:hypothetical protein
LSSLCARRDESHRPQDPTFDLDAGPTSGEWRPGPARACAALRREDRRDELSQCLPSSDRACLDRPAWQPSCFFRRARATKQRRGSRGKPTPTPPTIPRGGRMEAPGRSTRLSPVTPPSQTSSTLPRPGPTHPTPGPGTSPMQGWRRAGIPPTRTRACSRLDSNGSASSARGRVFRLA